MRKLPLLIMFGLFIPLQDSLAAELVSVDPTVPMHLQTLTLLKRSKSVVPPQLDVHPITAMYNREAIVPPQCYTRTEGQFNPCYVCHQNPIHGRENAMSDGNLQVAYSFSEVGLTNQWRNLFEDRSAAVASISDAEIRAWIDEDNYADLAPRLRAAGFEGWIPDLDDLAEGAGAFDSAGFARDGSDWVAFNYKPLPSTFWPTNGSTDDVMIRLPPEFRTRADGSPSRDVYVANLAILEANIKGMTEVSVLSVDERELGLDIDGNARLTVTNRVSQVGRFVGAAREVFLLPWLYPAGTEFLHTVRYIGISPDENIVNARRMKEVRYMRKQMLIPKSALDQYYREEGYAKDQGYLPSYVDLDQQGLYNGMGWVLQGFIEDSDGRLRANTFEENMFCMGCHTSIGTTIDKTFSFPRKVDGGDGWGYINLHDMPDAPNVGETRGEIATYLQRTGGGDEFRSNREMRERWYRRDGTVDLDKIAAARDVYELITPSVRRALQLNKAYRTIVADQDYLFGRDARIGPPAAVYDRIDNATAPTLSADRIYLWDIRLDWTASTRPVVPLSEKP